MQPFIMGQVARDRIDNARRQAESHRMVKAAKTDQPKTHFVRNIVAKTGQMLGSVASRVSISRPLSQDSIPQ